MVVPFTEMGKGSGGAGKEWVGNQEPHFGLVQFVCVRHQSEDVKEAVGSMSGAQ